MSDLIMLPREVGAHLMWILEECPLHGDWEKRDVVALVALREALAAPPEDVETLRRDAERYRQALLCIEILQTSGLGDIAREALGMRCLAGNPEAMRQKAEALRRDAERLDWLTERLADTSIDGVDPTEHFENGDEPWSVVWRTAIDAAMQGEKV